MKLSDKIRQKREMEIKFLNEEVIRKIDAYLTRQFVTLKVDYIHELTLRRELDILGILSIELHHYLKQQGFKLSNAETLTEFKIIEL